MNDVPTSYIDAYSSQWFVLTSGAFSSVLKRTNKDKLKDKCVMPKMFDISIESRL